MKVHIRSSLKEDINGLKAVVDSSELFPSEYLDEMMFDYFNNQDSEDIWFTCLNADKIIGLGYCVPEKLTDRTYNLLAIGVSKDLQGKGVGRMMMVYIEQVLKEKSKRLLIVETSSDNQYKLTREFYEKLDYRHEATIRDFWREGEDKIIYWKILN